MRFRLSLPLLLVLAGCGGQSEAPEADATALVSTTPPTRGTAPVWLTAYGSATPSQTGTVTLSMNQPGQVSRLVATSGAKVHAGETILIFAVAPTVRSQYEQAATQVRLAREQRDTNRRLLAQQLATNDQMTQAEKALADAETALAALTKEGAGSAVQVIRAPFDGVVTTIPVAQGDRTQPGAALATVARSNGIVITVGVPAGQATQVRRGQQARVRLLDGDASIAGRVVRVDGAVNPQTKLVDVDIGIPAGTVLPGTGTQVDIATAQRSGWLVPHQAVVTADGDPHLFQIAGGKAKQVAVTILSPGPKTDLVDGPIDARLPLIVDGAYQVAAGTPVRTH